MGSHGASWGGAAYERARESFSNPLMRRYESQYRFATLQTYPDGVTSDFHFAAEQGAQHAWRYPDLTTHVRYFSDLLRDGRLHADFGLGLDVHWPAVFDPKRSVCRAIGIGHWRPFS